MDKLSNNLSLQLTEQNVYANWIRNGLITTLIGVSILGLISVVNREGIRVMLKFLGIGVILLAIVIFLLSASISNQFNNILNSQYPSIVYHSVVYLIATILIGMIIIIIFI